MNELLKQAQKYQQFGSFPVKSVRYKALKKIEGTYMSCIQEFNSFFFMRFFNQNHPKSVNVKMVQERFMAICQMPKKMSSVYCSHFTQSFSYLINSILDDPETAAKVFVREYKSDTKLFNFFADLTFPSIFCYFMFDEFSESAAIFLRTFFKISKNKGYSMELLSSFFASATHFYDSFFQSLSLNFFEIKSTSSNLFDDYFQITKNALISSIPNLPKSINSAFNDFDTIFPEESSHFFVEKCLLNTFSSAIETKSTFFSWHQISKEYKNFLKELLEPKNSMISHVFVDIVLSNEIFSENNPKISGKQWGNSGISLLFSRKDISFLFDITHNACEYRYPWAKDQTTDETIFPSLIVDVYPTFLLSQTSQSSSIYSNELFGFPRQQMLQQIANEDNEECSIVWRNIIQQQQFQQQQEKKQQMRLHQQTQQQQSTDEIEKNSGALNFILANNQKFPFFRTTKFRKYALNKITESFCANFSLIDQVMSCSDLLSNLKLRKKSIKENSLIQFHEFSFRAINKAILKSSSKFISVHPSKNQLIIKSGKSKVQNYSTVEKISDAIGTIFGNHCVLKICSCFDVCCTAFDSIKIKPGKEYSNTMQHFKKCIDEWQSRKWIKKAENCGFHNKLKYVFMNASSLTELEQNELGRKLKLILSFEKGLMTISDEGWNMHWKSLFKFSLYSSNVQPSILTTFLFFHHFIFVNDKIVKYWGEGIHSLWGMFSAGMWSVLKNDPEFCGKCSNPEFVKAVICF